MVSDPGQGRIWRIIGGFGLLSVFLSSQALFAVETVTCPNGEIRSQVNPRELAVQYEAGSMADTLSGLSVLGARAATTDPAALQQAAVATWRWNQLLQGLADRYNRCVLTREQYAQALGKVYPRLREDAADLQQILELLVQGKTVEEKRLGILLDSYSANLRRFAELCGQDVLLDRIAAVVKREGGGGQEQVLTGLASAEKTVKETPLTVPEAAERRIEKKLATKARTVADDYRKGFELYQRYRFEESVPFFERALAQARVPELYAALGRVLLQLSQLDRAEVVFREGLALARQEKDADREAELLVSLGEVLLQKGDLPGALASARQALALQEESYGAGDFRTFPYHVLVGQILNRQGDLAGAMEATRRALQIAESSPGPDHPDTAVLLASLGSILEDRGDLEGALEYQRRALRLFETSYGPDYFETVQVLTNIGGTLFRKGDLEGARQVTTEALRRNENLFGPDHLRVAGCLRNLGMIHLRLGNLDAALQETRRSLQIYERVLEPDDPDIAVLASNLGQVLWERGDLDAALHSLERALRIDEKISGHDHPDVAMRANLIAGVLREKGDLQRALVAVQRALRIDEKTYSLDHPNVARDSETLARILLARGDLDGALAATRRALNIDEVKFGANHKNVARDSDTLAAVLLARGDTEAALRSARRALAIGEETFGPELPVVAQYARRVGLVLQEKGDLEGARSHFGRAHQVFQAKYGPDHPMTRQLAQDLQFSDERTAVSRKVLSVAALVLLAAGVLTSLFFYRRRIPAPLAPSGDPAPETAGSVSVTLAPEVAPEAPAQELTRIGPYRLEERLGAGGMGVVYRAYDERLDRQVAVKIIPPGQSRDPQRRERLRREAQASARLSHPAIIQVHDFVQTDEGDGIVMELVEGKSLARLLWHGPLDLPHALQIARDIADALAEAHAKGIIHRDLKAENVIITPSGRAKILDFGIAKRLDQNDPALTTEGAVIGTYRAMAPEQAQGHEMDHRADLFALGTLFYEMFTGQSPFLGTTAADTLWRICCHRQSPARAVNPRVPEGLSELIDQLLQKEPQQRPRDAREVAAILAGISDVDSSSPTVSVPELEAPTCYESFPPPKHPAGS